MRPRVPVWRAGAPSRPSDRVSSCRNRFTCCLRWPKASSSAALQTRGGGLAAATRARRRARCHNAEADRQSGRLDARREHDLAGGRGAWTQASTRTIRVVLVRPADDPGRYPQLARQVRKLGIPIASSKSLHSPEEFLGYIAVSQHSRRSSRDSQGCSMYAGCVPLIVNNVRA